MPPAVWRGQAQTWEALARREGQGMAETWTMTVRTGRTPVDGYHHPFST
jgi:hypothetical protein